MFNDSSRAQTPHRCFPREVPNTIPWTWVAKASARSLLLNSGEQNKTHQTTGFWEWLETIPDVFHHQLTNKSELHLLTAGTTDTGSLIIHSHHKTRQRDNENASSVKINSLNGKECWFQLSFKSFWTGRLLSLKQNYFSLFADLSTKSFTNLNKTTS